MSLSECKQSIVQEQNTIMPLVSSGVLPGVAASDVQSSFGNLLNSIGLVQAAGQDLAQSGNANLAQAETVSTDMALKLVKLVSDKATGVKGVVDVQASIVQQINSGFERLVSHAQSVAIDLQGQIANLQGQIDGKQQEIDDKKQLELKLIPLAILGLAGIAALGTAIGVLEGQASDLEGQIGQIQNQQSQVNAVLASLQSLQKAMIQTSSLILSVSNGIGFVGGDIGNIVSDLQSTSSSEKIPPLVKALLDATIAQLKTLQSDVA